MSNSFLKITTAVFVFFYATLSSQTVVSDTIYYSGTTHTFVMPFCASNLTVDMKGGAGGNGTWGAGYGGSATVVITPTPGQPLYINVGGQGSTTAGGWNGGGNGGKGSLTWGAGGGGATDLRVGGNTLAHRIAVMGGGGGGGASWGVSSIGGDAGIQATTCANPLGAGGAPGGGLVSGASGTCAGGTSTVFGSGGSGGGLTSGGSVTGSGFGSYGSPGILGIGGEGGGTVTTYGGFGENDYGAGGGGGGYYGGSGGMSGGSGAFGAGSGGGGGSSFIDASYITWYNFGGQWPSDGLVIIKYTTNGSLVATNISTNVICSGNSVTFSATGATGYTWFPTTGFAGSNSASLVLSPTVTTVYTLQTINSLSCSSTTVFPVYVYNNSPTLTINASPSATACQNQPVSLTASGAHSYTWSLGVTNGQPFYPLPNQPYHVTAGNACGTATGVISVSVLPIPTLSIGSNSVCQNGTLTLLATGNATAFVWSPGNLPNNSVVSQTSSPVYTVSATNVYGCTNIAITTISVVPYPSALPSLTTLTVCYGDSLTLSGSGASTYSWSTGATTPSIVITPVSSATYTLERWNSSCKSTNAYSVAVKFLPAIFSTAQPSSVCPNFTSALSASGGLTYTWTGAPSTLTGANVVVTPSVPTVYTVAASDGTCVNTHTVSINTLPNPVVTMSANTFSPCNGQSVTITASGANTYTWTSGTPSVNAVGGILMFYPSINVHFTVVGTSTLGCLDTTWFSVIVNPLPSLTVTSSHSLVCPNGQSTLTASGASSYTWHPSVQSHSVIISPSSYSIYTVTGSYSTGCQATNTIAVNVFFPYFTSPPVTVCEGNTATLNASGAISYTWANSYTGSTYTLAPVQSMTVGVAATSFSNGLYCNSNNIVAVTVNQNPTITAIAQKTTVCENEPVTVNVSGADSYTWSTGQTFSMVTVYPAPPSSTYQVIGTNSAGCSDTLVVDIHVSLCTGLEKITNRVEGLRCFPNPGKGRITITATSAVQVNLVNGLGQLIMTLDLSEKNNFLAGLTLAPGVYFAFFENYTPLKIVIE